MTNLPVGTLTDENIDKLAAKGILISENFSRSQIKQACYELRAGDVYYCPLESDVRHVVKSGEYILIKPRQQVVVITLESISLPNDMLARILTKGKLFSIGLSAVNTYADPGFDGRLGIVFCNLSNNYLKIYPGTSIAKIEFSKLSEEVKNPYHGQHGYHTDIWPIPKEMIATDEEIKKDKRVSSPVGEVILSYGGEMGKVLERLFSFERGILLFSSIYFFLTFVILAYLSWKSSDGNGWSTFFTLAALGVVSSLIASIIVYYATVVRRWR